MKKVINSRPIFFCAIFLIIACALAVSICRTNAARLWVMGVALTLFLLFLLLRVFLKIKIFALLSAICLVISVPFLSLTLKSQQLSSFEKFNGSQVNIVGKIRETKIYNDTTLYVIMDSAELVDEGEPQKIDGNVAFYVQADHLDLSDLKLGKFISVVGDFKFFSLVGDYVRSEAQSLSYDIAARGNVYFYQIEFLDRFEPTLRDNVRESVYQKLSQYGGDFSDIGYAMLFGESSVIDEEIVNAFRSTSIAHLLAVSGLHVSVIVLSLQFLLKKLRSPKVLNILLIGGLLGFYCYLCDFSVSVIRASLMAVALLYVRLRGKPYDRLTVLSLVAMLILLISPLQIFSISFILSFSAVLSIILLMMPLTRIFSKVFFKKFASTLALILSVQIGLLVISIYEFGMFSPLGLLTNFVSVPVASLAFVYLIYTLLLSFIFPIISPALGLFSMALSVVVKFNFWVTGLGLVINFDQIRLVAVCGMLLVTFIVSDYVFVRRKAKAICAATILIAVLAANFLLL